MANSYAAFADTMKDIVGGFGGKQMIAIAVLLVLAIALGFMIGALSMYASGVRKGRGQKKASERAMKEMRLALQKEKEIALAEADKEKQALVAEKEAGSATLHETLARLEEMEATKKEAEAMRLEAEKNAREANEQIRIMREKGEAMTLPRKSTIDALTKDEILAFANGLDEHIPANVYARGGEDLPDSCRVGICTFMLVYERKGTVKLVLRMHKKTAADLKKQYKLFAKAAYPKGGDWYKWILTSEVGNTAVVAAAIRMSYKYVYNENYDASGEVNVEYVNKEEAKMNEDILRNKDLLDRDFIVASDASGAAVFSLYGKKEMAAYAASLKEEYPVTVQETESETAPSTCKVEDKTFFMSYEKGGVAKMIFRVSEAEFEEIKKLHPKADVSPFPKSSSYKWYAAVIDESFRSNEDIEKIIMKACAHVYSYGK
ncbi:MAG: hypothetical protein J6Y74_04825 [Clostridia bacterium]|nr:hypothetical protein [Clostridia bacterium]